MPSVLPKEIYRAIIRSAVLLYITIFEFSDESLDINPPAICQENFMRSLKKSLFPAQNIFSTILKFPSLQRAPVLRYLVPAPRPSGSNIEYATVLLH
jgi:hypothetical protein